MATRQKYIDDLIDAKASDDEIVEAVKIGESRGLIDNDTAPAEAQKPEPSTPILEALGPRSYEASQEGKKGISQLPSQALDLASLPGRAISGIASFGGEVLTGTPPKNAYESAKKEMAAPGSSASDPAYLKIAKNVVKDPATVPALMTGGTAGPIVKGLSQGVVSGLIHQAESVSNGKDIDYGSLAGETVTSGALGGLGKFINGLSSKGLKSLSSRIQGTKVKINSPEYNKGAQNELYGKYGVFGDAKKVKSQWQEKIDNTSQAVKEKINQTNVNDPENYTFVKDVFEQAEKSAEKYGKSRTAKAEIKNSIQTIKKQFEDAYPDGKINILDAQSEKQVIGKKGDWLAHSGKMSGNPDAATSAQAHNALYDAFKTLIENKGSPGIKELNNQLSEMIPMERAAAKQVLVSQRKNLIPLDDYIGALSVAASAAHGNPAPAAIAIANAASKSPFTANGLHSLGSLIEKNKIASGVDKAVHSKSAADASNIASQAVRSNIVPPPEKKKKRYE